MTPLWSSGTTLTTWISFWRLDQSRQEEGVSLSQVSPDLDFWSDVSDVGWGAYLAEEVASGLWSSEEISLSINAMERGVLHFQPLLSSSTVSVFVDNSTAVAYLRKQGGTRSLALNAIAQRILHWAEHLRIVLAPQFIMGRNSVLADFLSRPIQIQGSE